MSEFLCSFNEGNRKMKELLGVKGANLSEMTSMGLPVPFGFVVTTRGCKKFFDNNCMFSEDMFLSLQEKIQELEEVTGKKIWQRGKPAACFSAYKFRSKSAYNGTYGAQPGPQR